MNIAEAKVEELIEIARDYKSNGTLKSICSTFDASEQLTEYQDKMLRRVLTNLIESATNISLDNLRRQIALSFNAVASSCKYQQLEPSDRKEWRAFRDHITVLLLLQDDNVPHCHDILDGCPLYNFPPVEG